MADIKLTEEQEKALLLLGAPDGDGEVVNLEVLYELENLGLVRWHVDLTDKGDIVYDRLLNAKTS